jgi:hypothetical protein
MKLEDESFPTVTEIRQAVSHHIAEQRAGQWPEDDWLDIGDHWSVNVWIWEGKQLITVYPDQMDGQERTTDTSRGITIE